MMKRVWTYSCFIHTRLERTYEFLLYICIASNRGGCHLCCCDYRQAGWIGFARSTDRRQAFRWRLLKHIAVICRADFYISGGATQEEMDAYYEAVSLNNLKDIQAELLATIHIWSRHSETWRKKSSIKRRLPTGGHLFKVWMVAWNRRPSVSPSRTTACDAGSL